MKAIVLAGGFGTRLYPLTKEVPKSLLFLGKKTVLDHLISKLDVLDAIDEIIIVTNGKFYLDFYKWRKNAQYQKTIHIVENKAFVPEKRLGAINDLDLALRSGYCGSDDFLVFCGDNYFDFPLSHFLLPCLSHPDKTFVGIYDVGARSVAEHCGVVLIDEQSKITSFEEKPKNPKATTVSIGVYYFPTKVREFLYKYLEIERLNPDRFGDFVSWLSSRDSLYTVDFDGAWFDIGSTESLCLARRYADALESVT